MGAFKKIQQFFLKNNTNEIEIQKEESFLTPQQALKECIDQNGTIDIPMIANKCNLPVLEVIESLQNEIFQNPLQWNKNVDQGFETAEQYLSGNIYKKLEIAKKFAAIYPFSFHRNVVALENVLPERTTFDDIYVTLGSPFITGKMIEDFTSSLFSDFQTSKICECKYIYATKKWILVSNFLLESSVTATKTYGTDRMNMFKIIQASLNHEPIQIKDYYTDYVTNTICKVINKKETILVLEKQKTLLSSFHLWLKHHESNRKEIEKQFFANLACYRHQIFKGTTFTFPKLNKNIQLYPHQLSAIERILTTKRTLLSHDVGTGKTYIMIVAGMKLKQLHPTRKIIYVVPNAILMQWKEDFLQLYPEAKLKVIRPSMFTPDKRQQQLKDIRDENYDAILIPYSSFELIPLHYGFYVEELKQRIEVIDECLNEMNIHDFSSITGKEKNELERTKKSLEILCSHYDVQYNPETIYFNDLQIDDVFIDEAHNFKNLPFETHVRFLRGINPKGSSRCFNMYLKLKYTQKDHPERKIIFATGTPIVNSISDLYIMQKYLWEESLDDIDLNYFDNWIGAFGELSTEFEIDVDVNTYRQVTRFNQFHNLKQLSLLVNQFTDFYSVKEEGIPKTNDQGTITVLKTPLQEKMIAEISHRVDKIRSGKIPPKEDNLLKVTVDGRKLALDSRLLEPDADEELPNKISLCADKIYAIYQDHPTQAQLVFSDLGVVKKEFNAYDQLKLSLMKKGLEKYEIQFIHDATSEEKKEKLFLEVKNGKVKVLIGSTAKLGIGVNVQDNLIAIHHLDVPWRPADMVQREGRILRQGNRNESVYIFRYITEGTFDAYSWQILETKQNFISQLLSGCISINQEKEIDSTTLSYAEIKALAIGNPSIKKRFEIANRINVLKILKRQEDVKKIELTNYLTTLPFQIKELEKKITQYELDIPYFFKQKDISTFEKTDLNKLIINTYESTSENLDEVLVATYKGFSIYIPTNATLSNPFIVLKNNGRHTISIKDCKSNFILRIENYFGHLRNDISNKKERLEQLKDEQVQANKELSVTNTYDKEIRDLTLELKELDETLAEE